MAANCGGGARQPRFKEASPGAGMWSATPALTSSSCSASDRRIHALHVIAGLQLLHAHRVGLAAAGLLHLRSGSCLTPLVGGGRSVAVEPAAGVGAPAAEERTRAPSSGSSAPDSPYARASARNRGAYAPRRESDPGMARYITIWPCGPGAGPSMAFEVCRRSFRKVGFCTKKMSFRTTTNTYSGGSWRQAARRGNDQAIAPCGRKVACYVYRALQRGPGRDL